MNTLLSRIGLANGYNRRVNVDLFAGKDFMLNETSPEACARYAQLREAGHSRADSFLQAFGIYWTSDDPSDIGEHSAILTAAAAYETAIDTSAFQSEIAGLDSTFHAHVAASKFAAQSRERNANPNKSAMRTQAAFFDHTKDLAEMRADSEESARADLAGLIRAAKK